MQYVQYEQNFLVFVGKDEHVGPSDYVNTYNSILPDGNGAYTVAIPKPDISDSFQAGDTLYITAFTYNRYVHLGPNPTYYADPGDGGFYIDPDTGLYVFPNQRISPNILKVIY
jgi:hypothetical protein